MHGIHCRPYILPGHDFQGQISDEVYAASSDPDYLRMIMREDETMLVRLADI